VDTGRPLVVLAVLKNPATENEVQPWYVTHLPVQDLLISRFSWRNFWLDADLGFRMTRHTNVLICVSLQQTFPPHGASLVRHIFQHPRLFVARSCLLVLRKTSERNTTSVIITSRIFSVHDMYLVDSLPTNSQR